MGRINTTTWTGLVERDLLSHLTERMYCLANSKEQAWAELKRLAKKKHPTAFDIKITQVEIDRK